jgi:hypothetical protein
MLGARVAVGLVRLVVVLESRPRETRIIPDLLVSVIYIATALAVINFVFAAPIGGLVVTSDVVAIVLDLALPSTLSDVFSGIAIGLEHAYKAGDLFSVEGGVEGQVLQINWRSTQIATAHNSIAIVIVPLVNGGESPPERPARGGRLWPPLHPDASRRDRAGHRAAPARNGRKGAHRTATVDLSLPARCCPRTWSAPQKNAPHFNGAVPSALIGDEIFSLNVLLN